MGRRGGNEREHRGGEAMKLHGGGGREEEGEQRTENYENTFYRCVDLDAGVGAFIARVTCVCTSALPSALNRNFWRLFLLI